MYPPGVFDEPTLTVIDIVVPTMSAPPSAAPPERPEQRIRRRYKTFLSMKPIEQETHSIMASPTKLLNVHA
jgi:hypothetical protein